MAGTSLLAMLDDIATILDDISLMSKVAAKKTAGVLGDDLALNAEQVTGVRAERELPVVWAVAKGSFVNKMILVPAALVISLLAPWLITPLLMIGGAFLCFEGVEKLYHQFFHKDAHHKEQVSAAFADESVDLMQFEKKKIKGAIRTDFILSAEIIIITLGIVEQSPFITQLAVLYGIAMLVVVVVYGLVAGIVKLDDAGLYLMQQSSKAKQKLGEWILFMAPYLMKTLSVVGTIAMFLVGGGIMVHALPWLHHQIEQIEHWAQSVANIGGLLTYITPAVSTLVIGVVIGCVVLIVVTSAQKMMLKAA